MSKKGCFGEYSLGVSEIGAHIITPCIHFGAPKFGEQLIVL